MISIQEVVLVRFGCFTNRRLCFRDGLNVLYGENESGKSTIQLFLKLMFYGVPAQRKTAGMLRERERIIPWNEKSAEGILRLKKDERELEIRRRFGKTPAGDKVQLLDVYTGEPVSGCSPEQVGEFLLGMPADVFEKTFWLRQDGTVIAGKDDVLNQRLMNLRDTGREEISAERTLKQLEKEKRAISARDKRSAPGKLDLLFQQREEKRREQYCLITGMRQREAVQNRLQREQAHLKELEQQEKELTEAVEQQIRLQRMEARIKKWEQAQLLLDKEKKVEESDAYRRFQSLTEDDVQKAEALEREKETLDQNGQIGYDKEKAENSRNLSRKKEKNGWGIMAGGVVLLLLALVPAVWRGNFWIPLTVGFGVLGILFSIFGLFRLLRCHREIQAFSEELERLIAEERSRENKDKEIRQKLDEILKRYACKTAQELRNSFVQFRKKCIEAESFRNAFCALMEGENAEMLQSEAVEAKKILSENSDILNADFSVRLQEIRRARTETAVLVKELEGKLSYVFREGENPADLESELQFLDAQIEEQEEKGKAIDLAAEVFSQVYEKWKSDFTPLVNAKVNHYLKKLTLGKYADVRVAQDYRMQLSPEENDLRQAEYFSHGTYEQVYLALRLALGELLGRGDEPWLLDDFLTDYDDIRAKSALGLLAELGEKRQVLFFTCHRRDMENASGIGAELIDLKEEIEDVC